MSNRNSPNESSPDRRIYGTQLPGTSLPPTVATVGDSAPATGPVYGTYMAPRPSEFRQPVNADLPSQQNINTVTRTYRADSCQMSMILKHAERPPRAVPHPDAKGIAPETPLPPQALTGPATGKSTWNLRIRERRVGGYISGIINPIPSDSSALSGLQSAFAVDDNLPEYEVLGELGSGSMGMVYRARQTSLNRDLAIKTLKPDSPNVEHDQAMFVSEAVVTAHLVHPNIIPIHDLGRTADGKLFYSMKQVTGTPWNATIRDMSLEQNLEIFMKVCDAVAFAHSRGVINRDLKPENVIVGDYGEVIVLDWGLAITTDAFANRDSVELDFRGGGGTPVYMAPELAEDTVDNVGNHSDIYVLGAILFEIMEGFPPHLLRKSWHMPDPEEQLNCVIWAVLNNEIEPHVNNEGELMQIARKAMSTHPMDRFSSVESLQDAIREYRITGRAEELMHRVESKQTTSYAEYQSAVALYEEALRKWPSNRRALEGDRKARKAYAELALKKGDVDLGLQILPDTRDRDFETVRTKLKRTRRNRAIMRGTWGVATVGAAVAAIVAAMFFFKAENEKQIALIAKEDAVMQKEKAEEAQKKAESLNDELGISEQRLSESKAEAERLDRVATEKIALAERATEEANQQKKAAMISAADARTAKAEAEEQSTLALKSKELAETAEQKRLAAEKAAAKANDAIAAAEAAVTKAQKGAYDALIDQINALSEIRDFHGVARLIRNELEQEPRNPFVDNDAKVLRDKEEFALRKAGNASLELDRGLDDAVVSPDGSTVVVRSADVLTVFRNVDSTDPAAQDLKVELQIPGKNKSLLAVASGGAAICAVGKEFRNAWTWNGSDYTAVTLDAGTVAISKFSKSLFSPNGQHLYLIGTAKDRRSVIETYVVGDGSAKQVAAHYVFSDDNNQPSLIDAVLLPDESGIVGSEAVSGNVRLFRMKWSGESVNYRELQPNERADVAFPLLDGLVGLVNDDNFKPTQLCLSSNGQRLALVQDSGLLILPRNTTGAAEDFPFVNPRIAGIQPIKCDFFDHPINSVSFSKDNSRIVVTQSRHLQIWDVQPSGWKLTSIDGLYRNRSLTAHGDDVTVAGFVGAANNRLISCSVDNTLRHWNTDTYAAYVTTMKSLVEKIFRSDQKSVSRYDFPRDLSYLDVAQKSNRFRSENRHTPSDLSQNIVPRKQYHLTGAIQNEKTARRFQQASKIFSAEFSKDSQRVIVGANDLAAHAFHTDSGQRTLTASMLSPRDPFFAPDKNNFVEGHIPEIVSLMFLPPNGELLLTFDYFGSMSVWDAKADEDGIGFEKARLLPTQPVDELSAGQPYEVEDPSCEIAVSPDGKWLIAGIVRNDGKTSIVDSNDEYFAAVWNTEQILQSGSAIPVKELKADFRHQITAAAISHDSSRAVTATRRGTFVLWDLASGTILARADGAHNSDSVSGVFFVSNDEFISAGFDGGVLRWKVAGSELQREEIERPEEENRPDYIIRLRPSPDGKRFVTSDLKKNPKSDQYRLTPKLWSAQTGWIALPVSITSTPERLDKPYRHDISWSDDGADIMYVHDGKIVILDSANLKVKEGFQLPEDNDAVRGVFAPKGPDGVCVATFDGRFAHLWNLDTGEHVAEFRSHGPVVRAGFSADRKFVATASDSIRVFHGDESNPDHGRPVFRLPRQVAGKRLIEQVEFIPVENSYRFASIDTAGNVKLWNWAAESGPPAAAAFESGEVMRTDSEWMEEEGVLGANRIAWSSDGTFLGAVQAGKLRIWKIEGDAAREIEVQFPDGLSSSRTALNQLDFSSEDGRLVAGGVRYNDDEEVESWGAVWKLTDTEAIPMAVLNAEGSQLHSSSRRSMSLDPELRGITAIAFNDTTKRIISGGADSNVVVWNQPSGVEGRIDELLNLGYKEGFNRDGFTKPHKTSVTALDVAADGSLVSADDSGFIVIWPSGH